jgi:hypothetical protein
MSPAERAGRCVTLSERLRERYAERFARVTDLFVACGRAQWAAAAGDENALADALRDAADVEYQLFGDADVTGEIASSIGVTESYDPEP